MNENLSSRASGVSVVMLLLSLVLSPALAILHCAIFTVNHVEPPCTVGLPVFCQQRHVGLPALRAPRLVCVSAFWGWCRLCEPALCRRCLIGFCACCGWCLVVLPACGWCRGGMFWEVEAVTLGCLANFWLHRLGDVVVVAEPGGGGQSGLEESKSHMNIQTHVC